MPSFEQTSWHFSFQKDQLSHKLGKTRERAVSCHQSGCPSPPHIWRCPIHCWCERKTQKLNQALLVVCLQLQRPVCVGCSCWKVRNQESGDRSFLLFGCWPWAMVSSSLLLWFGWPGVLVVTLNKKWQQQQTAQRAQIFRGILWRPFLSSNSSLSCKRDVCT